MKTHAIFALLITLVAFSGVSFALTNVSSCQDIGSTDTYFVLNASLSGTQGAGSAAPLGGRSCIRITGSNLVFDCNGFSMTGTGSGYGILLNGSGSNITVLNCPNVSQYNFGVYVLDSNDNRLINISSHDNAASGFRINSSYYNTIENCSSYNNPQQGFRVNGGGSHNLTRDFAYNNSAHGFYVINGTTGNIFLDDNAQNNSIGIGFEGASPDNLVINGSYSLSSDAGVYVAPNSNNNVISGCGISNNPMLGFHVRNANTTLNEVHFYANGRDFLFNRTGGMRGLWFNGVIFDDPSGLMLHPTRLTLYDRVNTNQAYSINYSAEPSPLPEELDSFGGRFVEIANLSGTISIDDIYWNWTDAESAGYNDERFELWKYGSGSWSDEGAALDPDANTLYVSGLNPASVYAVVQDDNVSECINITGPGDYLLTADLTGAPNPLVYPVCIKINSSDVSLDCQGHSFTSTSSPQMAIAILSSENVTVKNCMIQGYYHGIYSSHVDSLLLQNNTLYDGYSGVVFAHTTNSLISGNSAFNNTFGFSIQDQSNFNRYEENSAYNNTQDGFYIYNSHNSNFTKNSAIYNLYYGFHLYYADYDRFTQNNMTKNGYSSTYYLSQLVDGAWEEQYSESFGVQYSTGSFPFKAHDGKVQIRVVQNGSKPFAAIDQIRLESCGSVIAPSYARYVDGGEDVLADILETDNNVVVSSDKMIEISWDVPSACEADPNVFLTANEYFAGKPILYPYSGYLSFDAGSNVPAVDGSLNETDGILAPSYSALWTPDSGHPAGNTYVYLAKDSENVYLSIDVTSDNTEDYAEDWVEAVFQTPAGEKSFRIDDLDSTYGRCGFGLTSKASYKHKFCEFSIPVDEIGSIPEQFRLRYYGTSATYPSGIFLELSDHNNITENNLSDNLYEGAYLYHADFNSLSSNTADRNGIDGFFFYYSVGNSLEGNEASDNVMNGFLISGGSDASSLVSNMASLNGEQGIFVTSSNSNTLTGNSVFSNDYNGIYLLGSGFNVLEGNNASDNTYCGIILGASSNNNLTDNLADGNGPSGTNDNIELYNSANNNRLLRNNATGGGRSGFYISYSDSNYLGNNFASGNALSGFAIDDGSTLNVLENSNGSANGVDGIYVENSNGNTIDPSAFCSNGRYGVTLNQSNDTIVQDTVACSNTAGGFYNLDSARNNFTDNRGDLNGNYNFYVVGGSDNRFAGNNVVGSSRGFFVVSSNNNDFVNNRADNSTNRGFFFMTSNGTYFEGNTAIGHLHSGLELDRANSGTFISNDLAHNNYGLVIWENSNSNTFTGTLVHENEASVGSKGIILYKNSNNHFANTTIFSNTHSGLYSDSATGILFDGGSIFGSPGYGAYLLSSNTTLSSVHFYNNTGDALVNNSGASPMSLQLQGVIFDSPGGAMQNFTNLSLTDSVSAATAYVLVWAAQPAAPVFPSFEGKYINISSLEGAPSIDTVVWYWLDSELANYTESALHLYRYNGAWTYAPATLSTSANTLTATNLASFSTFAILQSPPSSSSSSDSGGGSSLKSMLVSEQSICPGNILEVNVTSGGKPLADAEVTIYLAGISVSTNTSDADGVATFKLDKDGQYSLSASKSGYKDKNDIFMYVPCPPECVIDSDCPANEKCVLGSCIYKPECTSDSDCGSGKQCLANRCQAKPECVSDSDCGSGKECKSSKCQPKPEQPKPECATDSDCGSGKACKSGKCEIKPECTDDSGCQSGNECKGGKCVKKTITPATTSQNASSGQPGAGTTPSSGVPQGGSPLLLILGGLVLLVILAGIAYWYFSKNKGQKSYKK